MADKHRQDRPVCGGAVKTNVATAKSAADRLLQTISCVTLCALSLSLLPATSAFALTCPYPKRDVERIFISHHDRPEAYVLAYGVLRPNEPVPSFDEISQSRAPFSARFEGHLAQPGGFDRQARFGLTVGSSCLDDNCGTVPTGPAPALMFIRDEGGVYSLAANSCNDSILLDPTEDELRRALDCLNGKCIGE